MSGFFTYAQFQIADVCVAYVSSCVLDWNVFPAAQECVITNEMLVAEGLQTGSTASGWCQINQGENDFTLHTNSNTQCRLECLDGWYRAQSEGLPNVTCTAGDDGSSSSGKPDYKKCERMCVVWVSQ